MNYFSLMRNFWDFAFENPEKIKPNHCAIYCFAVEHCNRLGWKEKFGFPSLMAMDAVGIKCHTSYLKAFNELVSFGLFELVEKSKNQWSSNIIAISKNKVANDEALDEAIIKHASKHSESTPQSTPESNRNIIRPIYQLTNIPINQLTSKNENLISELENDKEWLNVIAMQNRIKPDDVFTWLTSFGLKLKGDMDQKNSKKDLCGHFSRWLPIELKKGSDFCGLNTNQRKEKIGGI
jgi:hypothetical protein